MVGQDFPSILDGSEQLRRRPMKRITAPLEMMGADIKATDGKAPIHITPSQRLKASPMICLLLADR